MVASDRGSTSTAPRRRRRRKPVGERAHAVVAGGPDRLHGDDALHAGDPAAHLRQAPQVVLALDDEQLRAGIVEAVGDVVGTVVDVHRHRDEPQGEGRLVEPDPLLAVAQHDRHAVAPREALGLQAGAHPRHLARGLGPGVGLPGLAVRVEFPVGHRIGRRGHALGEGGRDRVFLADVDVLLLSGGHALEPRRDAGERWGPSVLGRRRIAGTDPALHQHAVHPPAVLVADRAKRADLLEA